MFYTSADRLKNEEISLKFPKTFRWRKKFKSRTFQKVLGWQGFLDLFKSYSVHNHLDFDKITRFCGLS